MGCLPFPLTVMGVTEEEALAASSWVGDGAAKAVVAAANAAAMEKVFMLAKTGGRCRKKPVQEVAGMKKFRWIEITRKPRMSERLG